jgi:DNA-binding response OmpR family regulator
MFVMDQNFPTILLVEDDQALQAVLETALSDEGFEVVTADSGAAGMEALASSESQFQAVVTDIQLGKGPRGWDIGHRAREVTPGIPVIYMTGNSAHEWTVQGVPESVMLQKPFVMAQLVTALTTLLNHASSATALSDAMFADGKNN